MNSNRESWTILIGMVVIAALVIALSWRFRVAPSDVLKEVQVGKGELANDIRNIESELRERESRFDRIEDRLDVIEGRTVDRWKGEDMVKWRDELSKRNPSIDVPETE